MCKRNILVFYAGAITCQHNQMMHNSELSGWLKYLHEIIMLSVFAGLMVILPQQTLAQGNLLIMPRRVVFSGAKKTQELNLANIGKDTARFAISLINIRMTENGSFDVIDEPDSNQHFAVKYLRFFPHSVVLGPNESQVIRIQVTRREELLPGEYRSHIYFRAEPGEGALGEPAKADNSGISVHLVPVFGISIPVIIRVGEYSSGITFSGLSVHAVKDSAPSLQVTFNRSGSMSVYGDVLVSFVSAQGKKTQVGMVNGLAIYTPNLTRTFNLPLDGTRGIDYHSGKLHITFSEKSTAKPVKLAEADLVLN